MSRWFSRSPGPRSSAPGRFVRPLLETLEDRNCPSSAPTLGNLTVVNLGGSALEISGYVYDHNLSTVVVDFSGVVSAHVHTDSEGNFDFVTNATGVGDYAAKATDEDQLISNTVFGSIISDVPAIADFAAQHNQDGTWTFTGQVQDDDPTTATVVLAGLDAVANTPVVIASDGSFSVTVDLNGGDPTVVTATPTDCWGQTGDTEFAACPATPQITNLSIVNVGNQMYAVTGTVTDGDPSTVLIDFEGALQGSATVNSDGSFYFLSQANYIGTFTATATDSQYLVSTPVVSQVTNDAPVITNFAFYRASGNTWTVSGQVQDETPGSTTVVLNGFDAVNGQMVQPDTNGNFSWSLTLNYNGGGATISAQATDCWGYSSDVVYFYF